LLLFHPQLWFYFQHNIWVWWFLPQVALDRFRDLASSASRCSSHPRLWLDPLHWHRLRYQWYNEASWVIFARVWAPREKKCPTVSSKWYLR
jgi:hypothetical protein